MVRACGAYVCDTNRESQARGRGEMLAVMVVMALVFL